MMTTRLVALAGAALLLLYLPAATATPFEDDRLGAVDVTVDIGDVEYRSPCDPRDGPFSPCYYDCSPGAQRECNLILEAGQAVWHYCYDRGIC